MEVKLTAYEGPLDLLLTLIRKHEIDIYDIPISSLTDQYLQEVANMPPDMARLSEFLVMAATLLEIKSRMLLPRPKVEADNEPEDPREALVQKLLAYKQAQAIAEQLKAYFPKGEKLTNRGDKELLVQLSQDAKATFETDVTTVAQLMTIFTEVMSRKESRRDKVRASYGKMQRERFTITEKVLHIQQILRQQGRTSLRMLFIDCHGRNEMVVTFLALLEMVRRGEIMTAQSDSFADVEVVASLQNLERT